MPESGRGIPLLVRATRAQVLPVMLAPVAVGGALAWAQAGFFTWGWFGVTVVGAAAMHLGANVLNDYFDEASGADRAAREDPAGIATGTGLIASGVMTRASTLRLAASLFGVALACGVALAVARGPVVLLLGGVGFLLALLYVAPPVAYGYRGHGLGEAGIFISFGYLPLVGSFYVQALDITPDAAWASLAPGLLTTLVLYHHHFLHWRSDRAVGKMTPVAVLGPERGLRVSAAAAAVTFGILVGQTIAGLWPPGALAGLVVVFPLGNALLRAMRDPVPPTFLQLLGSSLGASVVVQALLVLTLVVRVLAR